MNVLTKKSLIVLLAVFTSFAIGCGTKSNKKGRVAPAVDKTVEAEKQQEPLNEDFETQQENPKYQEAGLEQNEQGEVIEMKSTPVSGKRTSDEDGYVVEEDYGQPYEIIEKDKSYGNAESPSSGERFGEFGVVLFDDPMWYPGLPAYPAGHSQSILSTIYTGGVSDNKYAFTDGKSDGLMAYAIENFKKIGTGKTIGGGYYPDVKERSLELAGKISDVKLDIDAYTTASVRLEIEFVDGNASTPVKTLFEGKLDGNRVSNLKQINIKGDKDLKFSAILFCADQDGGCQNAVIQVWQTKQNKICRMAYIVHRFGDAHLTMSESDRLHYLGSENTNHQRLSEYLSNTAYNSCVVNSKRTDIPNRLKQHLLAYCDEGYKKLPAAKTIGYKTWAAAKGASGFRLIFSDEAHWTGYDQKGGTAICGPLVKANNKNPIYSKKLAMGGTLGAYIKSAHLVNNDGGGNINLLLRTHDQPGVSGTEIRISVTSMIRNTVYLKNLRPEEKLPEDPRG